ncbi:hypothetical protein ID866_8908 [Astraeus odoratus]|nr:hypothetical protein ID866_8908 [Astraeus odoratus]
MPFWFWPCMRARQRLKDHIARYLNTPVSDEDVHIGADLARLHREQKTPLDQAVGSLLALKWGMFTNTFGIVFWLFAHLLNNPAALSAVRAEIDAAIDKEFGDFPAFLADASPKSLDRPCFQLLTSAIVETMRLGGLISIMHTAEQDCHLRNGEQMIPLQKGEFVLADVRGVHVDDSVYPDGYKFLYDRFAHCEHHPGILPTQGKPWFAFGFGRNVCKGRWLAMYQIKVLAIIYLHLFDFIPVANPRTSIWQLPRPRRLCLNSLRPEKDIIVHLRSRRNME